MWETQRVFQAMWETVVNLKSFPWFSTGAAFPQKNRKDRKNEYRNKSDQK